MREWVVRLLALGRRGRRDRDLADELAFHVEQQTAAHQRAGLDPVRARQAALRDLGGLEHTQQAWRDQRTWPPLDDLWHDVRYGGRVLRRSPGVTSVAALTLALAVAATTSVFTVVDAVLLAPLPYPHADRLVRLSAYYRPMHAADVSVAPGNFMEWRERAHGFVAMTAVARRQQNITGTGEPQQINVAAVSAGFRATTGVAPTIGRPFGDDEFTPGHEQVALLSHALWASRYGADPAVVGRSITLDGQPCEVVGVMPDDFLFPDPGFDAWVPLPLTAADRDNRTGHTLFAVGRLRDGVSVAAASREMHDVAAALAHAYPDSNGDWDTTVQSARDALIGDTRSVVLAVAGAVALLLLVACANVAGLLLTHGLSRGRELAIRMAVGAGRLRLVRQLLTESVLLALVAGAAGVGVAAAAQPLL
ncbi:MAG: ABC transporter permease, partial [Vicinamibacterales bacterium]